ncbi:MAG: type II secretion system protein [Planctomycetes bacterium]|nr:type II secretion system protein [Planctomycetota bacterium]
MKRNAGFTLVELVIVVMILGILVAIVVPRFVNVSEVATDNGLRRSLGTIREAIELCMAQEGRLPGTPDNTEGKFKADLAPYLRVGFPKCSVGPAKNDEVRVTTSTGVIAGEAEPMKGWHYSTATGQFVVNYSEFSGDEETKYDEF